MPPGRLRHAGPGRLHLHPRGVLQRGGGPRRGHPRGLRGGTHRQERQRVGIRFRHLSAPRCRGLHLRRGDGPHRVAGGTPGQAPPQAALSGRRRGLWLPLDGHQRRDDRRRADHPPEGGLLVRLLWKREQPRNEALWDLRARQEPEGRGGIHEHPPPGAHREALRRHAQRVGLPPGLHPGGIVDPRHEQGALRRGADGVRPPQVPGHVPRDGRHHHVRRFRRHGRRHPPPGTLLQARVLRAVHPVPGGNLLAGGRPDPHGNRRRRQEGDPHAGGDRPADRGPDDLCPR
mmetsp:Transcript_20734/g.43387  ORF Transcript_20734/g.43387 Transcript_20734/m.43387 type:complete len:288 (+) Transcript_20734:843-1706(+)